MQLGSPGYAPLSPPSELDTSEPPPPASRHRADRSEPVDAPEPASGGGALRHLFSALIGLVFTPAAIGALVYGGFRYHQMAERADFEHDTRGLIALGAGAAVLLLVAGLGALSPVGPLLGGLLCLTAAVVFLALPEDVIGWIDDSPLLPSGMESATVRWLALGSFLAVGAALWGTSITAVARKRS